MFQRLILLAGVIPLLISCEKKDVQFATNMGVSYTNLVEIDTVGINMSTWVSDSFATNGIGDLMIGSYADPLLGKRYAAPGFKFDLPSSIILPTGALYDSLSLLMYPTGYSYGDTLAQHQFKVYLLQRSPVYTYSANIYNTSEFGNGSMIGSKTKLLRPHQDSLLIRLSDAMGLDLFNKAKLSDAVLSSADLFHAYIPGIKVEMDSSQGKAIYTFNNTADSVVMRLYYHTANPVPEASHIDFGISQDQYYQQIIPKLQGTALAVPGVQPLSSKLTGNLAFTQAGAGIMTRVSFPSLRNLLQLGQHIEVLDAVLKLQIKPGSFSSLYPLPANILMASTDATNALGSYLYDATTGSGLYASPQTDPIYGSGATYRFDITSYIKALINNTTTPDPGFFITEFTPGTSPGMNRAVIMDGSTTEGSQLQISLLKIKE